MSENQKAAAIGAYLNPLTYGMPAHPITKADAARNVLALAAASCNLLAPETQLDFVPANFAISMRIVAFPGDGDWYSVDGGKFALTFASLNKLAAAAGITWLSVRRIDDGRQPLFWRYEAQGRVRLFDGTERTEIASRELDLRDGAPETLKKDGKEALAGLNKLRCVGSQQCESKAKARVIRALLGVRSYTKDESMRPFVWPALVYMPPDTEDVRRMVAAKELGMVEAMYGPRSTPAKGEIIDVPPAPLAIEDKGGGEQVDYGKESERTTRTTVRREVENIPDEPIAQEQRTAPATQSGGYGDPAAHASWDGDREAFTNALGKQGYELEDVAVWLRKSRRKQPNLMDDKDRRALYEELCSYGGNLPTGGAK
jgi:hypothetical protein